MEVLTRMNLLREEDEELGRVQECALAKLERRMADAEINQVSSFQQANPEASEADEAIEA